MVEQNDRIRGRIPEIFSTLMEPHLEKVDEVISPGLTVLRWTSLNIEAFLQSVEDSLMELELLVERVSNTLEFQIEGVLQDIQNTVLCELPDSEAWTVDEFYNRTQVSREQKSQKSSTMYVCVSLCAENVRVSSSEPRHDDNEG